MTHATTADVWLSVFGRTDPGIRRSENQDGFLIADLGREDGYLLGSREMEAASEPVGRFPVGPAGALLTVADGMGGAAAGSVASELSISYLHEELLREWVPEVEHSAERFATELRAAVERVNERVYERAHQHQALEGMGTTLTAIGVLGPVLCIAHVGDSRAYLVRSGRAMQLTKDHTMLGDLISAGLLSEEAVERSGQRGVLLRALGPKPRVEVDLVVREVLRGDAVLLCSDGLHGPVKHEQLALALDATGDPRAACDTLIRMANERGGPDNITVVVGWFAGADLDDPGPEELAGAPIGPADS